MGENCLKIGILANEKKNKQTRYLRNPMEENLLKNYDEKSNLGKTFVSEYIFLN